jgi:hypothetical protein
MCNVSGNVHGSYGGGGWLVLCAWYGAYDVWVDGWVARDGGFRWNSICKQWHSF